MSNRFWDDAAMRQRGLICIELISFMVSREGPHVICRRAIADDRALAVAGRSAPQRRTGIGFA